MSKELEIMREERERLVQEDYADSVIEECDLVIKALERLEAIDNSTPSEALECLEDIYRNGVFISEVSFEKQHPTNISPETNKSISVQCNTIKQALLKAQEQELHNGGRLPNKEILSLKQSIEQCNDKPIFYISKTYGNKYIVPQKQLDDLVKEKELLEATIEDLRRDIALLKAQEPKQYLKWEDLKFTKKAKEMRVKLGDTTYLMRYYKVNDHTNKVCISSFQFIEIYDIRFFNDLHLERVEE